MGNETIDKDNDSKSFGRERSNSKSHDVIQRSLLLPEEVRKLNKNDCIIFIRGLDLIIDRKYNTFITKEFKKAKKIGKYKYDKENKRNIEAINENSILYYKAMKERGENIEFININAETLLKYESEEIDNISEL